MWEWAGAFISKVLDIVVPLLLPVVGGTLMLWWKKREGKWATPIVYGLVTATCLWLILASVWLIKRDQRIIGLEETTPKVVQKAVTEWLGNTDYNVKRDFHQDWHFAFSVSSDPKRKFTVGQLKEGSSQGISQYVSFMSNLDLDTDSKNRILKLPQVKRQLLESELQMDLIRLGISYDIQSTGRIRLESRIPILGLTEWNCLERVRLFDGGIIFVREKLRAFLVTQ
jgi:hypothetical protein